jgi:hypothetical protein
MTGTYVHLCDWSTDSVLTEVGAKNLETDDLTITNQRTKRAVIWGGST